MAGIKVIVFDTFGTVVDWRGSITRDLSDWGAAQGITADVPSSFALYLQGVYRSDYTLEVVQQGTGSTQPTTTPILVASLVPTAS